MTDTTDYMRSRIIAHRDQPDIYDPPTREDMYDRILSDAETIKAAGDHLVKRLRALKTYFDLSEEELAEMTPNERADTVRQHRLISEALAAFNAALERNDD